MDQLHHQHPPCTTATSPRVWPTSAESASTTLDGLWKGWTRFTHATLGRTSRWRSLLASRPTGSTVRRVPPAPCRQVSARPGPVASWQSASPCRIDVAIVDLAGQSVRDPGDVLGSHPRGMKRTGGHRVYRDDQQRPSREGPRRSRDYSGFCRGPHWAVSSQQTW